MIWTEELLRLIKTRKLKFGRAQSIIMQAEDALAELKENQAPGSAVCGWAPVPSDEQNWETECGEYWMLSEGTPIENDMNFCPMCGKKLVT